MTMKENKRLTTYLTCLKDYVLDGATSVGSLTATVPYGVGWEGGVGA